MIAPSFEGEALEILKGKKNRILLVQKHWNLPDTQLDKEHITAELNRLVAEDHPVAPRWITAEELQAQPELVRTMSVKPPMDGGRVRLLDISGVDLQPCGGTHVAQTGEIGRVRVGKIENKGRQNRRINILFDT